MVYLWSQNLRWDPQILDFKFLDDRRVGDRDAVEDVIAFSSKLEATPGTPTETDRTHSLILRSERLGEVENFVSADLLAMSSGKANPVIFVAFSRVSHDIWVDNLAVQAVKLLLTFYRALHLGFSRAYKSGK